MKDVFDLYCPACGKLMIDIVFLDNNIEYPEKQCPSCKTIYQLGSTYQTGAHEANQVILIPRDKRWLKKNGKKLKGVLPDSW